ncbi:MAG TPA: ParB/RepB/Spo0J family partition protein [Planctomycetota bacterium]
MAASKKLGRGLNSLLTSRHAEDGDADGPRWVPVARLQPNPEQPRKNLEKGLDTLAASIRRHGIMQPLVVVQSGPESFEIVAGERRWRAAQLAGLKQVPVVIRERAGAASERLELALIENIQREDLDPIERALACRQLLGEYGLTQEDVAERLGFDRSTVANLVRLLELPQEFQAAVSRETISAGHGRALLRIKDAAKQKLAFQRIVQDALSVRAAEKFCATVASGKVAPAHKPRPRNPAWVGDLQEKLTRSLGSRAEIRLLRKGGGRLVVHFQDLDGLDRLTQKLELPGEAEELLQG